jgi:hypothetical protein
MDDLAKVLPQPRRTILSSRSEYLAAFDELVAVTRRELRIFDPDCAQLELNSPGRHEQLRQFLLASRDNRLFVAVHDPEHLRRHCPRMLRLVAEFSAAIEIRQTEGEATQAQDCLVIADMEHFLRRAVAAQPRGVYCINEYQDARGFRERYDEIWTSSIPAVSATTLGL